MEANWLNKNVKNLIIGDFIIACVKDNSNLRMEIPASGMAFYHPGEYQADFNLRVADLKPEEGRVIFGSDEYMIPTFLYEQADGEYDWRTATHEKTPLISYHISEDWTTFTLYEDGSQTNGERAFREFGNLFAYAVLNRDACVLHGVVMEYNGMGILVTAASGIGKTTHTRIWRDRENALVVNGDRCLCRKTDGKWWAYGMPWAGSSGEYINRKVPITAIVCLKQAKENSVRRMSVYEGMLGILKRIYAPMWKCSMQTKAVDRAQELAEEIPVLELSCRPDYEAVTVLKEAIQCLQ